MCMRSSDRSDTGRIGLLLILEQAAALCAMALVPAVAAGLFHPQPPGWKMESANEVALAVVQSWQRPVVWVDARSREEHEKAHIPGARRLTIEEWEPLVMGVLEGWTPGRPLVIYCDSVKCQKSGDVAKRLQRDGVGPVFILKGGWPAWVAAQQ